MTVTDLPTITRPAGLDRLRRLTGATTDDEAVNEAIRQFEAAQQPSQDSDMLSRAEKNRQWLAKVAANPPIKSNFSPETVVEIIAKGRAERTESLTGP